jgi:hypothetical protein
MNLKQVVCQRRESRSFARDAKAGPVVRMLTVLSTMIVTVEELQAMDSFSFSFSCFQLKTK